MEFVDLFLSAVMNPPSFNEWQVMNNVSDMVVTGTAGLFRLSAVLALSILALGLTLLAGRCLWSVCSGR
ncbi:hypothetical protein FYL99_RS20270 [Escherichia coli]|nr:hypothetical protein [Escherichia coli]